MTGLSDKERTECAKILMKMSKADLLSLCDTVTNKMIVVESDKAMDTILSFTMSAEELLKRRKVYRDQIFKYLAEEGIAMPPTSEKHILIKRTLELWSSKQVSSGTSPRSESPVVPHGLVMVAVAGTIHRDTSCLGIFEKVFGLIKSPLDNNWKIKLINLKIRGQDAISDREVSAPALTYNSSDLQLLCN
uniref:Chromosome 3 open reading frame 38 n=1 Tax=Neogobius melanostomus TaxID=47308 RepID=A0A8C6WFN5_9GOBI